MQKSCKYERLTENDVNVIHSLCLISNAVNWRLDSCQFFIVVAYCLSVAYELKKKPLMSKFNTTPEYISKKKNCPDFFTNFHIFEKIS